LPSAASIGRPAPQGGIAGADCRASQSPPLCQRTKRSVGPVLGVEQEIRCQQRSRIRHTELHIGAKGSGGIDLLRMVTCVCIHIHGTSVDDPSEAMGVQRRTQSRRFIHLHDLDGGDGREARRMGRAPTKLITRKRCPDGVRGDYQRAGRRPDPLALPILRALLRPEGYCMGMSVYLRPTGDATCCEG
jgi:hypothetical protein